MALLTLLACTPEPGTAAGRLVDARTGTPLTDAIVRLSTPAPACPPIDVRTDAAGRFTAANLCGGAAYTAAPADPTWYLAEPVSASPDTQLRAWHAPATPGVYLLSGTELTPLLTHTVVDSVLALGTQEAIRFPVEIPGSLPRLGGDRMLLEVGGVLGEDLHFEPLVPSPERRWFGPKDAPLPIDPWLFLGVRFTDDTTFARVEASLDAAHVVRVGGDRPLRYVGGAALPAGRYALLTPDQSRAFLLDFGEAIDP